MLFQGPSPSIRKQWLAFALLLHSSELLLSPPTGTDGGIQSFQSVRKFQAKRQASTVPCVANVLCGDLGEFIF